MIRRSIYGADRDPFIQREAAARAARQPAGAAQLEAARTAAVKPFHVVIVGAGLAGLCAAYELEQLGHTATLLEADPSHLGGRVRTLRFGGGLYGEAGAMRIPKNHRITRHYVSLFNLGLRKFVQSNDEAYYHVRGRRVRIKDDASLKALFRLTPAEQQMSLGDMWKRGVVKILEGLIRPELDDLESHVLDTTNVLALDQRSLQQLLEAAGLSEEAVEYLTSTWGLETSLPSAATEHLREELNAIWSEFDEIVGGTDLLPRAFADRLKAKPRNGCEVVRIEQDQASKKVTAVYRSSGGFEREQGDFLLCTLPLPVLARLEIVPRLAGPKLQAIRQISYDASTKVLAVTKRRFWEQDDGIYGGGSSTDLPTGFTYYPSDNAEAKDKAVSAAQSVLLASYTWGQPAHRLATLSQAEVEELIRRELARLHPQVAQEDLIENVYCWSWDSFKWSGGAFAWFQPGQHTVLHKDLVGAEGRIYFAGEHTSLAHTWMQGALESGQRAVAEMVNAAGS